MFKLFKKIVWFILDKILFNYESPHYFKTFYIIAERYTKFYQGDNNHSRETNGGWRFLRDYIEQKKPRVIFDVGAHIGEYALRINKQDPSVRVYCFEPVARTFDMLNKNIIGIENIIPVKFALSSAKGLSTIYTNSKIEAINTLQKVSDSSTFVYDGSEEVEVSTVDYYCKENNIKHIDMLKIDTEGHDLEVIRGAKEMIASSKVDVIQFEFGLLNTYSHTYIYDFYQFLKPFGYELYKIKPLKEERVNMPEQERTVYAYFVARKN
ncbi:MAG: FkbM family methyltransferase [Candidatus Azambacteria bacterium]|nr:FkbM family methyltransferase [Candidatus Azambacteria bacterium]